MAGQIGKRVVTGADHNSVITTSYETRISVIEERSLGCIRPCASRHPAESIGQVVVEVFREMPVGRCKSEVVCSKFCRRYVRREHADGCVMVWESVSTEILNIDEMQGSFLPIRIPSSTSATLSPACNLVLRHHYRPSPCSLPMVAGGCNSYIVVIPVVAVTSLLDDFDTAAPQPDHALLKNV
jgi:hypothetical protein